jgi:tetratricopeptide (TPR) repeat protein
MMLFPFLIAGALLAGPQASVPADVESPASRAAAYQAFLEGRRLESAGDTTEAMAALERAARLDPTTGYALAELAQLHARLDQGEAARDAARRALQIEPDQPEAHWVLGMLDMALAGSQSETGTPDREVMLRAIGHFTKALPSRPYDPAIHVTLGRLYLQTGQPADAVEALSRAYDRDAGALEAGLLLAQALDQTGERARAIEIVSEVLDNEPRFFRARLVQADLLERARRWDDAATAYGLAAAENPRAVELQVRQAAALLNAERSADARDLLVSVIAAHPADLQARYLLAQAQREQGDLDGAEATGRALRELAPNDSRGPVVLSQVYADRRQHAKVIEVLTPLVRQPAAERATTSSGALGLTLRLAGAHLALGQYDAAIEVLEAARTERSEVVVDTYLLQTLVAARRFERALVVGEQVRAARPADPMPARLVAQALQGVGRTDEALAILTAQRDSRPDDPMALIALASVLSAASRHEEAVAAIEQGASRFGNDTVYWFQRGAVHERAGEAASAEEAFRRALALDPEHAPTLNYLGYMYAERGERLPEAVRLVQQALAIDPDNGSYLDSLGWAYFKQGRLNEARRYLQRAAELLPDNSVIQDHYGDVLRALGDRRGAIAAWERAISGDGESVDLDQLREKIDRARRR